MRLLLVDHRDSYVSLLHQALWTLTGETPRLVQAASRDPASAAGWEYDALILSPGPGKPGDNGTAFARALLAAHPQRPVLGVCLGHQILAEVLGLQVKRAAHPAHGRVSAVRHGGTGLYLGLDNPFQATRYHSLAVDPASLSDAQGAVVPESWAEEDGTLMGLRASAHPWWGVQFHPESVATRQGLALLANFLAEARAARFVSVPPSLSSSAAAVSPAGIPHPPGEGSAAPASAVTSAFHPEAKDPDALPWAEAAGMFGSPAPARKWRVQEIPGFDPARLFASRLQGRLGAFWLDGEGGAGHTTEPGWGATVLGCAARAWTWERRGWALAALDSEPEGFQSTPHWPAAAWTELPGDWPASAQRLLGGAVGALAYEAKDAFPEFAPAGTRVAPEPGQARLQPQGMPYGEWLEMDWAWVKDGATGRCYAAYAEEVEASLPPNFFRPDKIADADSRSETLSPPIPGPDNLERLAPWDFHTYAAKVAELREAIADGELYEGCLTFPLRWETESPPDYLSLRRRAPAPYAAYVALPTTLLLSASPELFLDVDGQGGLTARPMKGTRRRDADPLRDRALAEDLAASEKDRAENLMIADLLRNDLGRVCRPGSLHVPWLQKVETHARVHQMVTEVRARLQPGLGAWDALAACFPGGSMTGAPKARAIEILEELESVPRGYYSGCFGVWGGGGELRLAMTMRTLLLRGRELRLGCGGAVLLASDAESEWQEAWVKAESVLGKADEPGIS